jgi:hypothetical protein
LCEFLLEKKKKQRYGENTGIMRGFVVIICLVAFCIALWQVSTVWQLIEYAGAYAESTGFFSLLVAFVVY